MSGLPLQFVHLAMNCGILEKDGLCSVRHLYITICSTRGDFILHCSEYNFIVNSNSTTKRLINYTVDYIVVEWNISHKAYVCTSLPYSFSSLSLPLPFPFMHLSLSTSLSAFAISFSSFSLFFSLLPSSLRSSVGFMCRSAVPIGHLE